MSATPDPVLARREVIRRLCATGKRIGYGLFGVAIAAFVVGAVDRYTPAITAIVAASLGIGSVLLIPSIIFAYGVKAADREDRAAGRNP